MTITRRPAKLVAVPLTRRRIPIRSPSRSYYETRAPWARTVRTQLGRPDSTQDIGDQLIWYYETSANSYQVTFTDGVVDGVNRYGK